MRIDEQARQCVAFLSVKVEPANAQLSLFRPVGTVFFIGENLGRDRWIRYAVTARHVIDGSRPHGPLHIRCVARDGGNRKMFLMPQDDWWSHPLADIAVAPITIPLEEYDLAFLPTELFADEEWMRQHDVGIGDHLAVPGLMAHYVGTERDEPSLRFGRISLIPRGKISVPPQGALPGMEMDAILAELAAWGGQSGSPVFVYFSIDRGLFAGSALQFQIPNPRLLGVVHGYFTIAESVRERDEEFLGAHVPLNSGIAILVPARKITEVLESEASQKHRELLRADFAKDLTD